MWWGAGGWHLRAWGLPATSVLGDAPPPSPLFAHLPLPLQSPLHDVLSQAFPVNPSMQLQIPDSLVQVPLPLHSTSACAVSSAVALSDQAVPKGQTLSEQDEPCHPSWQTHSEYILQVPRPLHFSAQDAREEGSNNKGRTRRRLLRGPIDRSSVGMRRGIIEYKWGRGEGEGR